MPVEFDMQFVEPIAVSPKDFEVLRLAAWFADDSIARGFRRGERWRRIGMRVVIGVLVVVLGWLVCDDDCASFMRDF